MKNPILPGQTSRTILAAAAATAIIGTASAFAQVTIPSKSASSFDGEGGTRAAAPTAPTGVTNSPFSGNSSVSRVKVPTATGGGKVTKMTTPVTGVAPTTEVTAVQTVPLPQRELDPATMKRLAELRRELGIATAALSSRVALPADELFGVSAPTSIDDLSVPTLKKVTEYIELNDKKKITVQAFYDRSPEAKGLAWARTLALIEWMTATSSINIEDVKAAGPAPIVKPTAKVNATTVGETEYVNRIELLLE